MFKKLAVCIFLLLLTTVYALAQPGDPPDPDAPIDGGVSLLIAGGAFLGARMIQRKKK